MCDFAFSRYISRKDSDLVAFIMKPYVENMEISCPNDVDGAGEEENLSWSLSITNVPNDVYDDENTRVSRRGYKH